MPTLGYGVIRLNTRFAFITDPGSGRMNVAPGWGMHPAGGAYYNPNGPNVGEAAWMRMDANGHLHLESAVSATGSLLEGVLRPVAQSDPAPAPVRRKDGVAPAAPQFRTTVPTCTGRPVPQPDLFALQVREKPGINAAAPTFTTPGLWLGRPVAQPASRSTPVREKPGLTPTAPSISSPVIRSGRPVAQRRERPARTRTATSSMSAQDALQQHKRRQERRQQNAKRIALNVGGAHG